jgi:hypothetical protein
MLRLLNGNVFIAKSAISGEGFFLAVMVINVVFPNANLTRPTLPIFRKRRNLLEVFVPRVSLFFMLPQQFLFADFKLESEQRIITACLTAKILLDCFVVLRAYPFVIRIINISGPV